MGLRISNSSSEGKRKGQSSLRCVLVQITAILLVAGCGVPSEDYSPPATTSSALQTVDRDADGLPPMPGSVATVSRTDAEVPPDPGFTLLPTPELSVTGGGPVVGGGGGDAAAAARLAALVPNYPDDWQLTGTDAVGYMKTVASLFPGLAQTFNIISIGTDCALQYGVLDTRVYVASDSSAATALVIFSGAQFSNLISIATQCFVNEVVGGGAAAGAGTGWDPCHDEYKFDAVFDTLQDTFYVAVASTNENGCVNIRAQHAKFGPVPW